MAEDRIDGYADAVLAVAAAEGVSDLVEDELFRFAAALRSNEELTSTLSDRQLPIERRQQLVEDLLSGPASAVTNATVSMIVAAGRGGDLPEIIDSVIERRAASRNRAVARVRSAIELTEDQKSRLAAAIKTSTGTDVDVRVIIDPSVLGGLVTEIGDDVIDGSVRHRLNQLRESFR